MQVVTKELAWEKREYTLASTNGSAMERGAAFISATLSLKGDLDKTLTDIDKYNIPLSNAKFAKTWLLRQMAAQFPRWSIENSSIDIATINPRAGVALRALQKGNDWLHPQLIELLTAYCEVAQTAPIKVHHAYLDLFTEAQSCRIWAEIPQFGQPLIPVSTKQYIIAPILEHSLADPQLVEGLISAFSSKIHRLQAELGITALCFIDKEIGPLGALPMALALSRELNLPAMFYREGYWTRRTRLAGCLSLTNFRPTERDRICLVYDLVVTGHALHSVAQDLYDTYGWRTAAAVVLFDYNELKSDRIQYHSGESFVVKALGYYKDFVREASVIHSTEKLSFAHTPVLVSGERRAGGSPDSNREAIAPLLHEEKSMGGPPERKDKKRELRRIGDVGIIFLLTILGAGLMTAVVPSLVPIMLGLATLVAFALTAMCWSPPGKG